MKREGSPVEKLHATVRDMRHTRDAVAQGWESTLAALKRGARAAADEGAPQLYATRYVLLGQSTGRRLQECIEFLVGAVESMRDDEAT